MPCCSFEWGTPYWAPAAVRKLIAGAVPAMFSFGSCSTAFRSSRVTFSSISDACCKSTGKRTTASSPVAVSRSWTLGLSTPFGMPNQIPFHGAILPLQLLVVIGKHAFNGLKQSFTHRVEVAVTG